MSVCKLARFQDDLGAICRPTRKCKLAAFLGNRSEMAANATPESHENCRWFTLATKVALKNVLYYFLFFFLNQKIACVNKPLNTTNLPFLFIPM